MIFRLNYTQFSKHTVFLSILNLIILSFFYKYESLNLKLMNIRLANNILEYECSIKKEPAIVLITVSPDYCDSP